MATAEGILIASTLTGLLGWRSLRATRAARSEQLHFLDPFLPALEQPEVRASALGYPVARGRLDGHALRLELIPDTLAFRTLPVLWLEARWARPHGGRLRVVVRPTGAEYFGHDHTLTRRFDLGDWPVPAEAWGERGSGDLLQRLLTLDPAAFPAL
ncbi:MAG: hypothetical protein ABIQ49_04630, partial [Gemmatimonadales bacterium]